MTSWLLRTVFIVASASIACREDPGLEISDSGAAEDASVFDAVFGEDASLPDTAALDAGPICVDNVPVRFADLPTNVDPSRYLSAHNDPAILPPPLYTGSLREHFQGIQRRGRTLFVTGGVEGSDARSQLIAVEMGSMSSSAAWTRTSVQVSDQDRVIAANELDRTLWHAGGFQLAGNIAAIALETDGAGEIRFYDVSDPRALRELGPRVVRTHKIYAAAIVQSFDRRFDIVAWDDEMLEVFRSSSAELEEGLASASSIIRPEDVSGGFQQGGCGVGCGTYQSINLVLDCEGTVFMIATRNSQKTAPTLPGSNFASLYQMTVGTSSASLQLVDRKDFECHDRQCNFAAAAGIHVLEDRSLALYSAYHWLQDSRLLFNEFAQGR